MRLHRFIVDQLLKVGDNEIVDAELISQWRKVLRLEVGEKLLLSDGKGLEAEGTLIEYTKESAIVNLENIKSAISDTDRNVTLCLSVLKKENFELVCQKATEIGVKKIIPVVTARTVKLGLNFERLEKIIKEAAEQSGQAVVPEILPIMNWSEVLHLSGFDEKVIFDGEGSNENIKSGYKNIVILIGPEGGFEKDEITEAVSVGWKTISLGQTTLRAETAGVIATYLAVHNLI